MKRHSAAPPNRPAVAAVLAAALLLALLPAPSRPVGATAQTGGDDGGRYENGEFGYAIGWGAGWEEDEEAGRRAPDLDVLVLREGDATLSLLGIRTDDDPEATLRDLLEQFSSFPGVSSGTSVVFEPDGDVPLSLITHLRRGTLSGGMVQVHTVDEGEVLLGVVIEAPIDGFDGAAESARRTVTLNGDRFIEAPPVALGGDRSEAAGRSANPSLGLDTEAGTFTSPEFAYTVAWDPDVWLVREIGQGPFLGGAGGFREFLYLAVYDSFARLDFDAFVNPFEGGLGECVEAVMDEANRGTEDPEPLTDPETGNVIAGEDDGVAFAAVAVTVPEAEPSEAERVAYVECRPLGGGGVLAITYTGLRETYFEGERALAQAVLDTLVLAEDGGEGRGEADATPAREAEPDAGPPEGVPGAARDAAADPDGPDDEARARTEHGVSRGLHATGEHGPSTRGLARRYSPSTAWAPATTTGSRSVSSSPTRARTAAHAGSVARPHAAPLVAAPPAPLERPSARRAALSARTARRTHAGDGAASCPMPEELSRLPGGLVVRRA